MRKAGSALRMERVVDGPHGRAEKKGIVLKPPVTELSLAADETMLEAVIRNRVENAIKFSHAGFAV